jgi:ribosomal protein S8E
MSFLEDDLDVFFNLNEFARAGTLSGGSIIDVIFDRNPEVALAMMDGAKIIVQAKTSDVSLLVADDTLTIAGQLYYIVKNEPDGTGVNFLTLSEDA